AQQINNAAFGGHHDGTRGYALGVDEGGFHLGGEPGVITAHADRGDFTYADFVDDVLHFLDLLSRGGCLLFILPRGDVARQQHKARVRGGIDAGVIAGEQLAHFCADFHFNGLVLDLFAGGAAVGGNRGGGGGGSAHHQQSAAR